MCKIDDTLVKDTSKSQKRDTYLKHILQTSYKHIFLFNVFIYNPER